MILTDENFEENVSRGKWLVKFYAPWCAHCQKLAPVWDDASVKLKNKVRFGKLDSTSHKGITTKYGVKGYPTLKLFRDGVPKEYKGGRNLDSFVAYGERVVGTVTYNFKESNFNSFVSKNKVVFVLFEHTDPLQNTKLRALFADVAGQNYDEHYFGVVSDLKVLQDYKIEDAPRIGVLKEGELFLYSGPDSDSNVDANEHLTKWVLDNQFTLLPEMEHYLYGEITGRGKLVVVPIVDPHDKESKALLKLVKDLSRKRGGEFGFAWLNGPLWHQHIEQYELKADDLPRIVVINGPPNSYYVCNSSVVTADLISGVMDEVLAGKIRLYQSWSDWGKQISDEYGWWLIGGGVALFLLICIGCIVLTGGDDDDGRGQKKSS